MSPIFDESWSTSFENCWWSFVDMNFFDDSIWYYNYMFINYKINLNYMLKSYFIRLVNFSLFWHFLHFLGDSVVIWIYVKIIILKFLSAKRSIKQFLGWMRIICFTNSKCCTLNDLLYRIYTYLLQINQSIIDNSNYSIMHLMLNRVRVLKSTGSIR